MFHSVAAPIVCPYCGEDEELTGTRRNELIDIVCDACGESWTRDTTPRCPKCGSDDLETALRAILDKSRGTQLSISSTVVEHLCKACDPDLVERWMDGRTPLMPHDLPAGREDE